MFVIPCKFTQTSNSVIELVKQIREFHPNDTITVVDSDSEDKSYFELIKDYNVIIEDIANKHWMVGAYWHCFKKFTNEEFFYCLHDSMRVKANLDEYKNRDLTILCYFPRSVSPTFDCWNDKIKQETYYENINAGGLGVYGGIFFAKRSILQPLYEKCFMDVLPSCKAEAGFIEGSLGTIFEAEGHNLASCALYGDVLQNESCGGRSGPYPHNTSWQFPIEKFYASHNDIKRGWEC